MMPDLSAAGTAVAEPVTRDDPNDALEVGRIGQRLPQPRPVRARPTAATRVRPASSCPFRRGRPRRRPCVSPRRRLWGRPTPIRSIPACAEERGVRFPAGGPERIVLRNLGIVLRKGPHVCIPIRLKPARLRVGAFPSVPSPRGHWTPHRTPKVTH